MPCTPAASSPSAPTLPSPLSATPPKPSIPSFQAGVCCKKLVNIPPTSYAALPPGTITPAIVAALAQAEGAVTQWLDQLASLAKCPGE